MLCGGWDLSFAVSKVSGKKHRSNLFQVSFTPASHTQEVLSSSWEPIEYRCLKDAVGVYAAPVDCILNVPFTFPRAAAIAIESIGIAENFSVWFNGRNSFWPFVFHSPILP